MPASPNERRLDFDWGRSRFISGKTESERACLDAWHEWGRKTRMKVITRRSVLRSSVGVAAAAVLTPPYIANAAATTVETWWNQGYLPEEDVAFRALVADYEKASGNKIEYSLIPNAPLRQKEISAIQSGGVPDVMEVADLRFTPLNTWDDNLIDLDDIVEPNKSRYSPTALSCCYHYNNTTKKRAYYMAPMKLGTWPFHIWGSLVEKAGYNVSEIPNTWDAFLDFFMPVQDKLRAQGMRNIYAYGYQLTGIGGDPIVTLTSS
jgi:multiple sugar transport system substrate-binding protein